MMLKTLGLGDNVVDEYLDQGRLYPGGNALNFAVFAAELGCQSAYMGVFGDDLAGRHVRRAAAAKGLDISQCRVERGENGHAYVELREGERRFLRSNRGGVSREKPLQIDAAALDYIAAFNLVCTSVHSYINHALPLIKASGVKLAYDLSERRDAELLAAVCPHLDFAFSSCGKLSPSETLDFIQTLHACGAPMVLATRGAEGALFSDGRQVFSQAAVNLDRVIDTMAAGDGFLTAFLVNLLQKQAASPWDLAVQEALRSAAAFSAKVCQWEGSWGMGLDLHSNDGTV
jgi:sugar/nucleoside kinase (ribokinase family)